MGMRSCGYVRGGESANEVVTCEDDLEHFQIHRFTRGAFNVGLAVSIIRVGIAALFLNVGFMVLLFSVSKWDLIMNFVALEFVFTIVPYAIYKAYIRDTFQVLIE